MEEKYKDLLAEIRLRGGFIDFQEACNLFGMELVYEAVDQLEPDELIVTYNGLGDPIRIYHLEAFRKFTEAMGAMRESRKFVYEYLA